jgi:DNA-binding HxlR family transcriptional regulator
MAVVQAGVLPSVLSSYAAVVKSLESIDEVIHQKVRMGIMSALMARGETDFRFLKETLSVTDGNLSIHLSKLEEAGYILSAKEFVRKKPHTTYATTEAGRTAFHAYLGALERIVHSAGHSDGAGE